MEATHEPCYFHQYASYQLAKNEWVKQHPEATPEQYEEAMKALARNFGI